MLIIYWANFLFNLVGSLLSKRSRRSLFMKWGYLGMSFCHAVVFLSMVASNRSNAENTKAALGYVVMAFQVLSVLVFGIFLATPTMLFTTEVVAPETRQLIIPIAVLTSWILHFLLALLLPAIMKAINLFTFLIFALVCTFLYIIADFIYVETMNKSEDEIKNYISQIPRYGYFWKKFKKRLAWFKNSVADPKVELKNMNEICLDTAGATEKQAQLEIPMPYLSQPWYGREGIEHCTNLNDGKWVERVLPSTAFQDSSQKHNFDCAYYNQSSMDDTFNSAVSVDYMNTDNKIKTAENVKTKFNAICQLSFEASQFSNVSDHDAISCSSSSQKNSYDLSMSMNYQNENCGVLKSTDFKKATDSNGDDSNSILFGKHLFLQLDEPM